VRWINSEPFKRSSPTTDSSAFLSGIPEEVEREIDRLDLINIINEDLKALSSILEKACCEGEFSEGTKAVLTPFLIYCRLINHAIEFNKKFENF